MASTGLAGFTVFNRSVIVRIMPDTMAMATTWVAVAVLPAGMMLKWFAVEDPAGAHAHWIAPVSYGLTAMLGVLLVGALVRGTVRAQLLVENEVVDSFGWSGAPRRKLKTTVDGHDVEAEIDTSGDREIKLFVDQNLLRSVKVC